MKLCRDFDQTDSIETMQRQLGLGPGMELPLGAKPVSSREAFARRILTDREDEFVDLHKIRYPRFICLSSTCVLCVWCVCAVCMHACVCVVCVCSVHASVCGVCVCACLHVNMRKLVIVMSSCIVDLFFIPRMCCTWHVYLPKVKSENYWKDKFKFCFLLLRIRVPFVFLGFFVVIITTLDI